MELEQLNRLGIKQVSQLLQLDPNQPPAEFLTAQINSNQLDRWQSLAWLIVCVPGLTPVDARVLYAIGVTEPEQLESTSSSQLLDRINRFLRSPDGQSFALIDRNYNQDLANRWYDGLDRTRASWRMPSGYSRRSRWSKSGDRRAQHTSENSVRSRATTDRSTDRAPIDWRPNREDRDYDRNRDRNRDRKSGSRTSRATSAFVDRPKLNKESVRQVSKLKFYLEMSDDLEAAPSIGPKTSERFAKIKILTIADFLNQTAESMAAGINYKRITEDVIRQWQHQARLVCRVPNLRGHDAQLMVACGITEPEDLANRSPQGLFKIIEPFAKSKEGLKIIRGGKQPDLEEITDWISWARETRSLQAA